MNIREPIKTNFLLLITLFIILALAEMTQLVVLQWLGIGMKFWIFLNLYWIGICCFIYFSDNKSEFQTIESEHDYD